MGLPVAILIASQILSPPSRRTRNSGQANPAPAAKKVPKANPVPQDKLSAIFVQLPGGKKLLSEIGGDLQRDVRQHVHELYAVCSEDLLNKQGSQSDYCISCVAKKAGSNQFRTTKDLRQYACVPCRAVKAGRFCLRVRGDGGGDPELLPINEIPEGSDGSDVALYRLVQ